MTKRFFVFCSNDEDGEGTTQSKGIPDEMPSVTKSIITCNLLSLQSIGRDEVKFALR